MVKFLVKNKKGGAMRVIPVNSNVYVVRRNATKNQGRQHFTNPERNVNFRGKFGSIVGGTLGAGAVLVASFVAAPAAACLAGAGLIIGLVGGDIAEDAINKEGEYKDNKKNNP